MNNQKQNFKIRQVRNLRSGELFVTSAQWPIKEIDGVEFLTVKKSADSQQTYLMRKEGLEFIK
jgi:hypothetical protein